MENKASSCQVSTFQTTVKTERVNSWQGSKGAFREGLSEPEMENGESRINIRPWGEERPFKKRLYQLAALQLPEISWLASWPHLPASSLSNAWRQRKLKPSIGCTTQLGQVQSEERSLSPCGNHVSLAGRGRKRRRRNWDQVITGELAEMKAGRLCTWAGEQCPLQ